jgi:PKD domain
MKKKAIILVCMLIFATISSVAAKGNENTIDKNKIETRLSESIHSFPLLNSRKMAYGQCLQSTNRDLVTFDLSAPNPWTVIGPGTAATQFLSGGDFVADVWYACEYSTTNSNIWTIDETTGTMTLVGASGALLNGIAYDDSTDTLYGVSSTDLYTINKATGIATHIGAMGNVGAVMIGIASDGLGHLYGEDLGDDYLYSINTGTGAATQIGPLGVNIAYAQDMAIDKDDGSCYITGYKGSTMGGGALMSVNLATGAATLIGNFPIGSMGCPAEVDCFAIPYSGSTNEPPAIPSIPSGPTEGTIGVDYTFTSTTTDPESDNISIMFDWGDGNFSAWLGPYASGSTINASHAWASAGTYSVKARAKDTSEAMSNWSTGHDITITAEPVISLAIKIGGKIGHVTANITNTGTIDATNIGWTISLNGGLIILGKNSTGNILALNAGKSTDIQSKFVFGFGKPTITVKCKVGSDVFEKTATATVLLFFVLNVA